MLKSKTVVITALGCLCYNVLCFKFCARTDFLSARFASFGK